MIKARGVNQFPFFSVVKIKLRLSQTRYQRVFWCWFSSTDCLEKNLAIRGARGDGYARLASLEIQELFEPSVSPTMQGFGAFTAAVPFRSRTRQC